MNVALTRAKSSVFILGNAGTLDRSDENWKKIVADSKLRLLFNTVGRFFIEIDMSVTDEKLGASLLLHRACHCQHRSKATFSPSTSAYSCSHTR